MAITTALFLLKKCLRNLFWKLCTQICGTWNACKGKTIKYASSLRRPCKYYYIYFKLFSLILAPFLWQWFIQLLPWYWLSLFAKLGYFLQRTWYNLVQRERYRGSRAVANASCADPCSNASTLAQKCTLPSTFTHLHAHHASINDQPLLRTYISNMGHLLLWLRLFPFLFIIFWVKLEIRPPFWRISYSVALTL